MLSTNKIVVNKLIWIYVAVIVIATFFSRSIYNYTLPEVEDVRVAQTEISKDIHFDTTYILEEANEYSQVNCIVQEVLVQPGDNITKGQPVALLDVNSFEEAYTQAMTDYYDIKSKYEKLKARPLKDRENELIKQANSAQQNYNIVKEQLKTYENRSEKERILAETSGMQEAEKALNIEKKNYDASKELYKLGAISEVEYNSAEQKYIAAQNAYDDAALRLKEAKTNYNNLVKGKQAEVATYESQIEQLERSLAELRTGFPSDMGMLENLYNNQQMQIAHLEEIKNHEYKIVATVDGVVISRNMVAGSYITRFQNIMTVGISGDYKLQGYVSNKDIGYVNIGDIAEFKVIDYEDNKIKAAVKSVAKNTENGSENVKILVEFSEDNDQQLLTQIKEKLKSGEKIESVILKKKLCERVVPNSSIVYEYNEKTRYMDKYVYVIRETDKAFGKDYFLSKIKVNTGFEGDMETEVSEGVNVGDKIVLNPTNKVKDGGKIYLKAE